jgi:hypothetical protein
MAIGAIFMPKSAFLGNDFGLDVEARLLGDGGSLGWSVGMLPLMRVSRGSRARVNTFLGMLLPGTGVRKARGGPTELYFSWNIYPIDVRLGRYTALSWDGPRFGPSIPVDGSEVTLRLSSAITLSWLSISD